MANALCPNCGPIHSTDVVEVTEYDSASATALTFDACGNCQQPIQRVA